MKITYIKEKIEYNGKTGIIETDSLKMLSDIKKELKTRGK